MSVSEGAALPASVVAGLSGPGAAEDQATILATVDEDGLPRFSLLSRGELEVLAPDSMAIALWASSRTAANLARTGSCALYRVDDGTAHSVRLRVAVPPQELDTDAGLHLSGFRCTVVDVLGDAVAYATISGVLSFRLAEPEPVLARWSDVGARLRGLFLP